MDGNLASSSKAQAGHNKVGTLADATAQDVMNRLNLAPHPEGGFYRETYRSVGNHGTAIYYVVAKGNDLVERRIRGKDEVWHFYAGDPIEVTVKTPDRSAREVIICGPDIFREQKPQFVIRADHWQTARCLGEWTLFGCTVSPAFEFENLEFATDCPK